MLKGLTLSPCVLLCAGVFGLTAAETAAPAAEASETAASETAAAETAAAEAAPPGPPGKAEGVTFLPLTVTSEEEGLGKQVRSMLRAKAKRLGAVVYDPHSVRDLLAGRTFSLQTPPEALARLGRDSFHADVVVVGRVAGREPYQIRLLAVYTDTPEAPGIFRRTYRAANHHLIPVEVAGAVYDILGLPKPKDPLQMLRQDPQVARRWKEAPNLVKNPGFEKADPDGTGPAHWQKVEPQMAWTANPDGPGKVIRYEMNRGTAITYGLDFYSDWIPIQAGATYRFACRYKTLGPTPKIFLKGYHPFPAQHGYPAQRRETYRRQVHPKGGKGEWHTVTADFIPSATRPEHTPTFLKVDLYAYWPAGVIYWDDVVLKKVRDAPTPKDTTAGDDADDTRSGAAAFPGDPGCHGLLAIRDSRRAVLTAARGAVPKTGYRAQRGGLGRPPRRSSRVPRFARQTVLLVWPGRFLRLRSGQACPAGRTPIDKQSVAPGAPGASKAAP